MTMKEAFRVADYCFDPNSIVCVGIITNCSTTTRQDPLYTFSIHLSIGVINPVFSSRKEAIAVRNELIEVKWQHVRIISGEETA
jgi:hypothetical protein